MTETRDITHVGRNDNGVWHMHTLGHDWLITRELAQQIVTAAGGMEGGYHYNRWHHVPGGWFAALVVPVAVWREDALSAWQVGEPPLELWVGWDDVMTEPYGRM